jgi:catechol 2,3-dioxygenase
MVKTKGLVHFTIPVSDLERSARFYTEFLGMRVISRNPDMVFLKCGGDYLVLGKTKVMPEFDARGADVVHHAFKVGVEEFDQAVEFLKQKGVKILRVEDRQKGVFMGRSAYFSDPDGTRLEIHDAQRVGGDQG